MTYHSLAGSWRVASADGTYSLAAAVPGCIHHDLRDAGVIPDPNWRDQETRLLWIAEVEWVYTREFDVPEPLLGEDQVELVCEGLDTLARVELNGRLVLETRNMHRTYATEVKALLQPRGNRLVIRFSPTTPWLREKAGEHPLSAWNEFHHYRHRGWLRKQHSNFGWDWSPALVSCGIWRDLGLRAWSAARLEAVRVAQTHRPDGAVALRPWVEVAGPGAGRILHLSVTAPDGSAAGQTQAPLPESGEGPELVIAQPLRWWPADLGEQPLYRVAVELRDAAGAVLDRWERRLGLRTLELARRPDAWGESFQFEANGEPFFAKGANWVNPRPYPSWPTDGSWRRLLEDAVAAHHNMIRIWGGGYYCPDEFYDACDELGLTVWQDMLFACGPYPSWDEEFRREVAAETGDNVRRLRHHACLALWCGNNEVESGFLAPVRTINKMSFEDYDRLFNRLLPDLMARLDPAASFWPASPVHGSEDRKQVRNDRGDLHLWEIWFSDAPFENYRNYPHRFISEFGFQSMPHPRTIESYTEPSDRQFNSPVMEFHQRSQPGNQQQLKHLLQWFRFPKTFPQQVFLSQLVQALCLQVGIEHFRRNAPRTMGTLYWQLNDCWPCPSWSSIDFAGRWKALHYFTRRCFAPRHVLGIEDPARSTVRLYVCNDTRAEFPATLSWCATTLDGQVLRQETVTFPVPSQVVGDAGEIDLSREVANHGRAGLLLWLTLAEGETPLAENLVLLDRPKRLELPDPGLTVSVEPAPAGAFTVRVTTVRPALWTWLDLAGTDCRWSDNFRPLPAGATWSVTARPARTLTMEEFQGQLRVESLRGTY